MRRGQQPTPFFFLLWRLRRMSLMGACASRGVAAMKTDLNPELDLLNQDVDEMIQLCQCAADAGLWTRQEAQLHTARLESLRTKMNTDFQELMVLGERLREARKRAKRESLASIPEL
jgi:hypothetical protein